MAIDTGRESYNLGGHNVGRRPLKHVLRSSKYLSFPKGDMLTLVQLAQQRRRRPPPSLKQQYQQYIMQRIEGYKNSIPREELLRLGDEAVAELDVTIEGQFVLTEVLMQDSVDRLIRKRLSLRSYRRWCQQYRTLRSAQREPTHWGIDAASPVVRVLPRLEPGDLAVVIGAAAESIAYLLAAHDAEIVFIANDLATVERVESRATGESLAYNFAAIVARLGHWLPEFPAHPSLIVLDSATVGNLGVQRRSQVLLQLQELTNPGGAHLIVQGGHALAPDAFLTHYSLWGREDIGREKWRDSKASMGLLLSKPVSHTDSPIYESNVHGRRA